MADLLPNGFKILLFLKSRNVWNKKVWNSKYFYLLIMCPATHCWILQIFKILLPNTTLLIQPLNWGIIAAFKMYYVKQTFKSILDSVEEKKLIIVEACKKFTIMDCNTNASFHVKQLWQSTLNACLKKNLLACVKSESFIQKSAVKL